MAPFFCYDIMFGVVGPAYPKPAVLLFLLA